MRLFTLLALGVVFWFFGSMIALFLVDYSKRYYGFDLNYSTNDIVISIGIGIFIGLIFSEVVKKIFKMEKKNDINKTKF